jgi:GcrA cell cycle regulator
MARPSNGWEDSVAKRAVSGTGLTIVARMFRKNEAKMSWTDERVELLRQLWLDGRSASQISAELGSGVTRNAVIGKVHRLGLSGRAKSTSPAVPRVRQRPAPTPRTQMASRSTGGGGMVRGNTALAFSLDPSIESKPVFHEDVVVPMSLRVTIVELKEAMCRWPLGDPTTPEFRYCGIQSAGPGPYCTHHGRMAYQPAQDRRRERERDRRAVATRSTA